MIWASDRPSRACMPADLNWPMHRVMLVLLSPDGLTSPRIGSHVTKPETTLRPRVPLSQSPILQRYAEKTPGSARLHARAVGLFADGVTHVGRYLQPHASIRDARGRSAQVGCRRK